MALDFFVYATKGSFSHEVAKEYLQDFDLNATLHFTGPNSQDWMEKMLSRSGFGVIPYLNSSKGSVHDHVSGLLSPETFTESETGLESKLEVVGEHVIRVAFDLYANKNIQLSDLANGTTHPIFTKGIALQQAKGFLESHNIATRLIESDTAEGLVRCSEQEELSLALTRSGNTHEQTYLLAEHIEPNQFNSTRFLVILNKQHPQYRELKNQVTDGRDKKKLFIYSSLGEVENARLIVGFDDNGMKAYRTYQVPSKKERRPGRIFIPNVRILEFAYNRNAQRSHPEENIPELFEPILGNDYRRDKVAMLGAAPRHIIKTNRDHTEMSFLRG